MDIHATIAHMRYTGAVSALAVALAAAPAYALEDSADSPAPAANEIVVTAQKRNERLQDVPISITVVNPELLESTNARNFSELQGVVPGVFFHGNSGGGRTYITLRGATP